jgi:hypothetical protein
MRRLLILCALLVMLPLGASVAHAQATNTPTPLPDWWDWCRTFDFTLDDFDAVIDFGTYGNVIYGPGFVTDSGGNLFVTIDNEIVANPLYAELYIEKGVGIASGVNYTLAANVFGYELAQAPRSFGELETVQLMLIENQGIEATGNLFQVFVGNASNYVRVTKLRVAGMGVNPFDTNDCGRPTPTPSPTSLWHPTPSATPTLAVCGPPEYGTPEPTWTPLPTVTDGPPPVPQWEETTWDFTSADPPAPFSLRNGTGEPIDNHDDSGGTNTHWGANLGEFWRETTQHYCTGCTPPGLYYTSAWITHGVPAAI